MRRALIIVSALAVALALGPSASAVPSGAMLWDTWCDFDRNGSTPDTYLLATGDHTPGWKLPWSPGDSLSGGIWMGGDQTLTFPDGSTLFVPVDPPAGLRSRVTECRVEMEQPDGFKYVADPAWIYFPPGAVWWG